MSESNKSICDVLVVGAGPVGLFAAHELHRHGLTCRIIDKNSGISDKSKAVGLHVRTLEVFSDASLLDSFLDQGHRVDGVTIKSDNKILADVSFSVLNAPYHFLIDIPQNKTESILLESLNTKKIAVEWETEVTGVSQTQNGVSAVVSVLGESETIAAKWLLACDGAHSTIRHELKLGFEGAPYPERWWLADVHLEWEVPDNKMVAYLAESGAVAFFPLGNKRYRVIVLAPDGGADNPNFEDIMACVSERVSDPHTLSDPIWITGFKIHHRLVERYRVDRIFVAGDAAHIHSPAGGQGLNTGIQDVYNLVWKLALVHQELAPSTVLDTYHTERYAVGKSVLQETDIMTKMIVLKNPWMRAVRNFVAPHATTLDIVKNKIATKLSALSIVYPSSLLARAEGKLVPFEAGMLVPHLDLNAATNGAGHHLLAITQGTQFNLMIFIAKANKQPDVLLNAVKVIAEKYSSVLVCHVIASEGYEDFAWKKELSWRIKSSADSGACIEVTTDAAVLIRPDKYVGYLQNPLDLNILNEYLMKIFKAPMI